MEKVIRYKCEYCGKEFKMPDKHKCKFKPELRNCFTCKHLERWEIGGIYGEGEVLPNYPKCKQEDSWKWNIEKIKKVKYNMQCQSWKSKER